MSNFFVTIIMSVGVTTILLAFIYIGRKLQILDSLEKNITEIKSDIENMKNKTNNHSEDITGLKVHTGYKRYGFSNSPMMPNDAGTALLKKSGFVDGYPKFKREIFALMDSMNLRTLYDYEKGAFDALNQFKDNPAIDPLKNYAVNHPDDSLDLIFKVASWVIRDDYDNYKKNK